jgi:hypothetical protein
MRKLIYIASPYTIGDKLDNVARQISASELLMKRGFDSYAPLLNHYWNERFEHDWNFWIALCKRMVLRCDGILRLQGESKGVLEEITVARNNNIPVFESFDEVSDYFK